LALLDRGDSLREVGRRIGCGAHSMMRWRDARRRGGDQALRVRFSPGRPWKLKQAERKPLVRLLVKGFLAQGYRTDLWITARIAALIEQELGIHRHPEHIGRLLHELGWSPQKPKRHAVERDEEALALWK
jgi:transposase